MCSICKVHEGDAAHLHVTTKTTNKLTQYTKIHTTAKKYHKTIITSKGFPTINWLKSLTLITNKTYSHFHRVTTV